MYCIQDYKYLFNYMYEVLEALETCLCESDALLDDIYLLLPWKLTNVSDNLLAVFFGPKAPAEWLICNSGLGLQLMFSLIIK